VQQLTLADGLQLSNFALGDGWAERRVREPLPTPVLEGGIQPAVPLRLTHRDKVAAKQLGNHLFTSTHSGVGAGTGIGRSILNAGVSAQPGRSIVLFVRTVYVAVVISTVVGAACVARAAQAPAARQGSPPVVAPPVRLLAEQLEDAGLTVEAAAEALRALPTASLEERARYSALLIRLRDQVRASDAERRKREHAGRMMLAQELAKRGLREEARRVYVSAAETAVTVEDRNAALAAAEDVAAVRVLDSGSGERVLSALRSILDNGVAALVVAIGLVVAWMAAIQPAIGRVEAWRKGASKTAVIQNFQDTTSTGLGRGFPDLIRTVYREQHEFRATPPGGAVLVPYHVPGGLPVLAAPAAESDFPWGGLTVAGAPVKDLLARWSAVWNAPWSVTSGTVYQFNQDLRVSVSIVTHGEQPVTWDSSLLDGVNPPRDAAYRVVFTLLDQWERRHG
jgi:hypothetical protein